MISLLSIIILVSISYTRYSIVIDIGGIDMSKNKYQEIVEKLREKVVGNDKLVNSLASIGSIHYLIQQSLRYRTKRDYLPRPTLFITGSTGTGKSYSVEVLSEILKIPYLRIDATTLSAPGWDGECVFKKLKRASHYSGILFIDELDKLSFNLSGNSGSHNKLIQSSLLDVLDGKASGYENLLIIAAGSFQDLRNEKKTYNRSIGFHTEKKSSSNLQEHRKLLIEGGIFPEIAGRFSDVVETEELTTEQIQSLILNPYSAYGKYVNLNNGIPFLTNSDIESIVNQVKVSDCGLREIDGLIFNYFSDIMAKGKNSTMLYVKSQQLKHARKL